MSNDKFLISDAQIHAFVDGELDDANSELISQQLLVDNALRRRIEQYRLLNNGLKALARIEDERPVPDRLMQAAIGRNRKNRFQLLKAIGLLIAGGAGGFFVATSLQLAVDTKTLPRPEIDDQLLRPALLAHATYVPELVHPVEVTAQQEQHLVQWLSKRLRYPLHIPELVEQGYALVGGRLLPAEEQGAAQFMYENSTGNRLTLYVRKLSESDKVAAFSISTAANLPVFYWVEDNYGFALSGDLSRSEMMIVGSHVYKQLTP